MRINQRFCGLIALAGLALSASACGGEGGEEAVFLYFINGYPGTSDLSVTSNRGVIASGIPFGERYGDNESCGPDASCLPSRIDRQTGSRWTVRMEGMPEPTEITKEIYSMYPHETGTVVFTYRSGETEVESTLLRHVQTINDDCALTFVNGLSTTDEYLGDFASFGFTQEFFIDDPVDQAIVARISQDETSTAFVSTCGALPTDDPTHDNLQRPEVIARILADPWFFMDCTGTDDDPDACIARWGIRPDGGRAYIGSGGNFQAPLNSEEYVECIQGAISIRQPEDAVAPQFPGVEPDCPPGELTWADVDVDFQVVQQCLQPVTRTATMVAPGQSDFKSSYIDRGYRFFCDSRFRIRAGGRDTVFGPLDGQALGSHGNGDTVESVVEIPAGAQRFWVLLGRPVNPIVWQWDSSETFVDLATYPYFNQEGADQGLRPDIGDTDK